MSLTKEVKLEIVEKHGRGPTDTGSAEVQVADRRTGILAPTYATELKLTLPFGIAALADCAYFSARSRFSFPSM